MTAQWSSKLLLHGVRAIVGGQGPPVVFIAGWPQTAEAWLDVMPTIAQHHSFLALDPPGLGRSQPSTGGYDTGTISNLMAAAVADELQGQQYHLVGHDIGAWIAYAWAAQHTDSLRTLSILDARIPGVAPTLPFPLPAAANKNLFQFSFNALPDLPEILTHGREREFLTWFFLTKLYKPDSFPQDKLDLYIQSFSEPGVMSRGFEYYRAVEKSSQQNVEFARKPLELPVLALGGMMTTRDTMVPLAKAFAVHVSGGPIRECGHFLAEEQPGIVAEKLLAFFAVVI